MERNIWMLKKYVKDQVYYLCYGKTWTNVNCITIDDCIRMDYGKVFEMKNKVGGIHCNFIKEKLITS